MTKTSYSGGGDAGVLDGLMGGKAPKKKKTKAKKEVTPTYSGGGDSGVLDRAFTKSPKKKKNVSTSYSGGGNSGTLDRLVGKGSTAKAATVKPKGFSKQGAGMDAKHKAEIERKAKAGIDLVMPTFEKQQYYNKAKKAKVNPTVVSAAKVGTQLNNMGKAMKNKRVKYN